MLTLFFCFDIIFYVLIYVGDKMDFLDNIKKETVIICNDSDRNIILRRNK